MEKYEYEYMVTSIVINKADEIAKVLSGRFNQEGYDGWKLVQWNLIHPSALVAISQTSSLLSEKSEEGLLRGRGHVVN